MEHLYPILGLGLLCGGWVLLQGWIARVDPEIGEAHNCGGCCSDKLCEIERNDPWAQPPAESS